MPLMESFSGVRGIYDDSLDGQAAMRYGYAYLDFVKKRFGDKAKLVIGTDTRQSREILKNALIEVFDCDIIDLGIASTPMVEFAVRHYKANGGVIITASHNEPYWNGFKFLDEDGAVLRVKDMDKVIKKFSRMKNLSNEVFFSKYLAKKFRAKKVFKRYHEINELYCDYVLGFLSRKDKKKIKEHSLKVILDPNGGAGTIAKDVLERLGVKVKGVNMKHGVFNRAVEPNEDSLFYLAHEVRKGYDFAAGFDCDADRVEIMAGRGLVSGHQLLALIGNDILEKSKNKIIVVNDATSSVVREIAKRHEARYYEVEAGEINVVDRMYSVKAPVGGEGSSGGVVIAPSKCRDGVLTLLFLLRIIANNGKLEDLIKSLPKYYNIKQKINVGLEKYNKIREKLFEYYKKSGFRVVNKGSLKIFLNSNAFVWFRASKTEANLLRVVADAPDKKRAEMIIKDALRLVKNVR